ncbi:GNAT family N-acetyltransferase [Paenibacillus protaetiae]|uniref:GNAT family N-acetyltransferase n=1 Tax=Paenibacillus protaetiae TaxID=2509456 RepID=A0A4P6EXL9_9BACL|nr:GNAT family N-acetyltransferase [Paenibacillus protaetiae]QAY67405.1 GNAT family N-acetyltransferase [Paenibacillus protaetiae]
MEYSIQKLGSETYGERSKLSQFAFQYRLSDEQLEKRRQAEAELPSDIWGVYVNGQLAAQLTIFQLQTYIGGKPFDMGGIAGVSTWPEYRRQGFVNKLLRKALLEMRSAGQSVSMLHPFAFAFYRKFGWETYIEYKQYTLKTDQLPRRFSYSGRIERIDGQIDVLSRIYDRFAAQYNGTLVRSASWWQQRVLKKEEQAAVYYDAGGEPCGYILYGVKEKKMTISEWVACDEDAYSALWSYVGQHDSMIDSVSVNMPADDLLAYRLDNPRIQQEIVPYFMARIVDAAAFVGKYAFQEGAGETVITLSLKDEHAPWNNGSFKLVIAENGAAEFTPVLVETPETTRAQKQTDAPECTIETNIGTLTALLLGYRSWDELCRLGRITGSVTDGKALEFASRIPAGKTYLADFF